MKFRNAHFVNLPMSDAIKITYFERLINDITWLFIDEFGQDVMRMTTKDWLKLPLFPVRLLLLPIGCYFWHKEVIKLHQRDCALAYTTYDKFTLYWRNYDDFETKPYMWNET